jgi:hypothetical protein
LDQLPDEAGYRYSDGLVTLRIDLQGGFALDTAASMPINFSHVVDVGMFHSAVTLLRGIVDPSRIHAINTPLLVSDNQ